MSDTNTSSEVSLYDNYNYENGKPETTFCPISLDTKNIEKINPNGTSGVVVVNEDLAATISSDDIKVGVVTLLVGRVTPENSKEIKAKITEMAEKSGGIGFEQGGVVALKAKLKERGNAGREQGN